MSNLGENFYSKLVKISSELGMKPEDILTVMVSESGIDPSSQERHSGASGLVQMMPATLKGLKFDGTVDDFTKLSGEDQLDWIKKLIQGYIAMNGGPLKSAAQYYVANFFPVALKLPGIRQGDQDTIFIEENPETVQVGSNKYSKKYYDIGIKLNPQTENSAYKANPAFHGSVSGAITYGDMVRQVMKNRRSPIYNKAITAMKDATNYIPGKFESMTDSHDKSEPIDSVKADKKNEGDNFFQDIEKKYTSIKDDVSSTINKFLQQVTASDDDHYNRKLYKKFLPSHSIVIEVKSKNYTDSVEFSRILCAALDEELMAKAFIHTDNKNVEVQCNIAGPELQCFESVKQLTRSLANAFKSATIKIGVVNIDTSFLMNKKSSYQEITLKSAQIQYRKFMLKFV